MKVGDKVKVKSEEWFETHPEKRKQAPEFITNMYEWCDKILTITTYHFENVFAVKENIWNWHDDWVDEVIDEVLDEDKIYTCTLKSTGKQVKGTIFRSSNGSLKVAPIEPCVDLTYEITDYK